VASDNFRARIYLDEQNEKAKKKAAEFLRNGSIFAFGLSEQAHGADTYGTEMVSLEIKFLTPLLVRCAIV